MSQITKHFDRPTEYVFELITIEPYYMGLKRTENGFSIITGDSGDIDNLEAGAEHDIGNNARDAAIIYTGFAAHLKKCGNNTFPSEIGELLGGSSKKIIVAWAASHSQEFTEEERKRIIPDIPAIDNKVNLYHAENNFKEIDFSDSGDNIETAARGSSGLLARILGDSDSEQIQIIKEVGDILAKSAHSMKTEKVEIVRSWGNSLQALAYVFELGEEETIKKLEKAIVGVIKDGAEDIAANLLDRLRNWEPIFKGKSSGFDFSNWDKKEEGGENGN